MACVESSENVEMLESSTDQEFVTVSRQSRKRKQAALSMDTNDSGIKRPHLPPVSGDSLLVCHVVCGVRKHYIGPSATCLC